MGKGWRKLKRPYLHNKMLTKPRRHGVLESSYVVTCASVRKNLIPKDNLAVAGSLKICVDIH